MTKLDYNKLMSHRPYKLGHMINREGQLVTFYEHPTEGDLAPVIAVWHEGQQAYLTDAYDIDDMTNEDFSDYQPIFANGTCTYFFDLR